VVPAGVRRRRTLPLPRTSCFPRARRSSPTIIECSGTFDALLPPGSCTSTAPLTVSNSLGGPEPLVPGPATYQLDLSIGTTIIDSKTVPITLE
jgi:hypothetical protein